MGLTFDPPAPMYTRPEADVKHFITDSDLALIKSGASNHLYDLSLALFGAACGFLQNLIGLGASIAGGKPITIWEAVSAMLFVGFAAGSISLFCSNRTKENPLRKMVTAIEAREKVPFVPAEAAPATVPNPEPAPNVAAIREQRLLMKEKRNQNAE